MDVNDQIELLKMQFEEQFRTLTQIVISLKFQKDMDNRALEQLEILRQIMSNKITELELMLKDILNQ